MLTPTQRCFAFASIVLAALAGCTRDPASPPTPPDPTSTAKPPPVAATPAATRPACRVVPPTAEQRHAVNRGDLDGDGQADALVPSDCDGRGACEWKAFLVKTGCATPLGSIPYAGDAELLPVTSHGIAMLVTSSGHTRGHHAEIQGWTGAAWEATVSGDCTVQRSSDGEGDEECGARLAESPGACIGGKDVPAPSIDVDGDGALEVVLPLPAAFDITRGNLLLAQQGDCLRPIALMPSGTIAILRAAAKGRPAILVAREPRDGGKVAEERVAFTDGKWLVDADRTCVGTRCPSWSALPD